MYGFVSFCDSSSNNQFRRDDMFSCRSIWSVCYLWWWYFCVESIFDSVDDACCENFTERGEEDNRSHVRWWVFRFICLLKGFRNSICYFFWYITCFCHGVVLPLFTRRHLEIALFAGAKFLIPYLLWKLNKMFKESGGRGKSVERIFNYNWTIC